MEKISAETIQLPYDFDNHFRNIRFNKVKNNSINVAEICDKSSKKALKVNLIIERESGIVNNF
ncbi:MAG TPA: hypothetical protein VLZ33_00300 [Dysgonamonadaceae bacterium]|nr:hypothetical protein [Dysgonamonadaceae bacterium]